MVAAFNLTLTHGGLAMRAVDTGVVPTRRSGKGRRKGRGTDRSGSALRPPPTLDYERTGAPLTPAEMQEAAALALHVECRGERWGADGTRKGHTAVEAEGAWTGLARREGEGSLKGTIGGGFWRDENGECRWHPAFRR